MSESRRSFLQKTAAASTGLLFARSALARSSFAPRPEEGAGLLFGPADLDRIRRTLQHPRFADFWKTTTSPDFAADRKFLTEQLRLNNHSKDFLQARQILERSAFVYAVTGSQQDLEIARLAIVRMLEYTRWDYFLDGGKETIGLQRAPETTIAMCCALDWLGDGLSTATRREIEKQIAEKGAPACYRTLYGMKYPERVRGWGFDPEDDYQYRFDLSRWPLILNSTNLKVIPIAGLGMAACLLQGKHPLAQRWLDLAISSAKAFSTMFGEDGAYDEGVGYWGYTAMHLTLLAEVVWRKKGIDLRSIINFPGTVKYGLRMSMPTNGRPADCVNFGDAWSMGDVSVAAWTARRFRDPIAQYVALNVGEIKHHFAAIWFDPDVAPQTPGPDLHDVRFSNDVVVARTGWDAASSVVALRSGGPANHEHADRNSVIFSGFGERFFHDPYKAAYSHTDPHWKLRLTESHSAVLIGGKGHQYHDGHEGTNASWAEAHVEQYEATAERMVVTSDATEAYKLVNPDVAQVRRTLVFLKPDLVILIDRIRLGTVPLAVQCRFQVDNYDGKGAGIPETNGFVITRPTAVLRASVLATGMLGVSQNHIDVPEQYGNHPFLEVESAPALDHQIVTAALAARGNKPPEGLSIKRTGDRWSVTGKRDARPFALAIDVSGDIPRITF
jgi:hypothetical protein